MLCAQALAVVSRSMRELAPGQTLRVLCNTEDVTRDLTAWATGGRHEIVATDNQQGATALVIRKSDAS